MPLWLLGLWRPVPLPDYAWSFRFQVCGCDPAFLYAKVPRVPEGEVMGFGLLTLNTLPRSTPLPASFSSTNGVFSFRVLSLLLYHHACFLSLCFM